MKRSMNIILTLIYLCTYTAIAFGEPQISNHVPEQTTAINITNTKDVNYYSYLSYLDKNAKLPIEYVLEKFNDHDLVIVGEIHHVKQNLDFLQQLIPRLYKEAGVRFLGYEFFASSCQKDIDKLVNSKEYDSALEKHIIRESAIRWGMMWPFQEYIDVFKIVWKLNQGIADQSKRFRIVFMAPDINWHDFHYGNAEQKRAAQLDVMKAEKYYADPIIEEFDNTGHKGLIWCGSSHAVTRLKGNPRKGPELRCGGLLHKQYGGKMFHVMLHAFWYYRGRPTNTDYALDGLLDNVLNTFDKPIGWDVSGSPFAEIKLPKDYGWAIDNPGSTFANYCEGYIWLVPLEEFKGNKVMDIAQIIPDEETFRRIRQNASTKAGHEIKSRQEFLAATRKVGDMFSQFQQTFMTFLSAPPKLNIPDNHKLIEKQEN
jgi:hypothetical protein